MGGTHTMRNLNPEVNITWLLKSASNPFFCELWLINCALVGFRASTHTTASSKPYQRHPNQQNSLFRDGQGGPLALIWQWKAESWRNTPRAEGAKGQLILRPWGSPPSSEAMDLKTKDMLDKKHQREGKVSAYGKVPHAQAFRKAVSAKPPTAQWGRRSLTIPTGQGTRQQLRLPHQAASERLPGNTRLPPNPPLIYLVRTFFPFPTQKHIAFVYYQHFYIRLFWTVLQMQKK